MFDENTSIRFKNVAKRYMVNNMFSQGIKGYILHAFCPDYYRCKEYEALHDVSFEIKKGEFFGLIGKNGAGKSTILGMIAQVISPTEGSVEVNGRVAPLLELGAGFHDDLTGRENIIVNGVLLGLTKSEIAAKVDDIIEFSGLGDFIDAPMRTYSSGMYMRLGFSVAIHTNPDILLVDEVLAVGDAEFQEKCMAKMKSFKENGVTIVFVSHVLGTAEALCDRVAYLANHTVVGIGNPKEMFELYQGQSVNE